MWFCIGGRAHIYRYLKLNNYSTILLMGGTKGEATTQQRKCIKEKLSDPDLSLTRTM